YCGELWANLGTYLWSLQRYDEAEEVLKRSLQLKPGYHQALATLSLVHEGKHQLDLAEACINDAIEATRDLPEDKQITRLAHYRFNRSVMYLKAGEYSEGFADYDSRIDRARVDGRPDYPKFRSPEWEGEIGDLRGKRLYLSAEQGVGDTI